MRTALAAGVDDLWLGGGADPCQPKVLRASAGAALALPHRRDPDRSGLAERLAQARAAGHHVVATLVDQAGTVPYWELDWTRPTVLLLGNEGAGLHPELAALALPHRRDPDRSGLAERLAQARAAGHHVVATLVDQAETVPYWELDWTRPTVLLLGNEGAGLHPELAALASHRVTIPHSTAVESLNVGVAAAPLLLERWRQQHNLGLGG